jgi:hypothetical protein
MSLKSGVARRVLFRLCLSLGRLVSLFLIVGVIICLMIVMTILLVIIFMMSVIVMRITVVTFVVFPAMMFPVLPMEPLRVFKVMALAPCKSKARDSNPNQQMTQRSHGIYLRVPMSFCNFQVFSYTAEGVACGQPY